MHDADAPRTERSLTDSVIRIIESGQRLVLDRLDLAYFDLNQLVVQSMRGAALIVLGAVLIAGAWFTLLGGAVVWLQHYLSLPASLIVVAAANAALGAAAILVGVRRTQATAAATLGDMVESVRGGTNSVPAVERSPNE